MFQDCLSFQVRLIDLVATIPEWCETSKTDIGRRSYEMSKIGHSSPIEFDTKDRIRPGGPVASRQIRPGRIEFDQKGEEQILSWSCHRIRSRSDRIRPERRTTQEQLKNFPVSTKNNRI